MVLKIKSIDMKYDHLTWTLHTTTTPPITISHTTCSLIV